MMTPKQEAALRLALEALEESLGYVQEEAENAQRLYGQYPTRQARIQGLKDDARKHMNAITAIREALADRPAQPCGYPYCGCNSKAWCKLERMAENARELGLDYEPPCKTGSQCTSKCQQCEQPAKEQKLEFVSPGGGYVPAIPRPIPLDWKLVPRKATPEMLRAMDECAQEGYDERLYEGMASSVYMAAWDASPVMGTLPEQPAQHQEPVVWMYINRSTHETSFQKQMRSFVDHSQWKEVPLYSEPLANQEKTSGSPKPAKPEALRLAELFEVAANAAPEGDEGWLKTAAELRRMHDLLGKANALCRIRAEEIERLKAQPAQEPVAWADLNALTEQFNSVNCGTAYRLPGENRHPLYTSPPASKPLTDSQIEADMFWNYDDAETPHDSVEEFLNNEICNGCLEVGAVFTLLRAKRLPNIKIKVTNIDENESEAEYEIIEAAHGIKEQS